MEATFPVISTLNSLIETCRDGEEGFRLAAEDASEGGPLEKLFTELSAQRAGFAHELTELVRSLDAEPETSSSLGGMAHRRWMDLRAVISGGDEHGLLVECEWGEAAAVEAYRNALREEALPDRVREVVRRQASAVEAAHDRIRKLRDAAR